MKELIQKVVDRQDLTQEEAQKAMKLMLSGQASQAQIGSFLTALRMKGETLDELTGFAYVLKQKAEHIAPKVGAYVDLVGTGGDRTFTFNVSTTAALAAAGAGLPVASMATVPFPAKAALGMYWNRWASTSLQTRRR